MGSINGAHRGLNFNKQAITALCIGEGKRALIFVLAMLKGRQQNFDGRVLL